MPQAAHPHITEPIYGEHGSVRLSPARSASLVLDAEAERFGADGRLHIDAVRLALTLAEAMRLRRALSVTIREARASAQRSESAVAASPVLPPHRHPNRRRARVPL